MDVSLTLVWSDSPLLLSYTRYLESGQQCSVVSTPLYNISFIWASLGGYGYSYPWYPPSPPSLPFLPPTPSYHGMLQRQSTDGLSWKLIRSSHLAGQRGQTTEGGKGGNLMLRLIFHGEIREFIVSASSSIEIGERTNFLVQPAQERPSK